MSPGASLAPRKVTERKEKTNRLCSPPPPKAEIDSLAVARAEVCDSSRRGGCGKSSATLEPARSEFQGKRGTVFLSPPGLLRLDEATNGQPDPMQLTPLKATQWLWSSYLSTGH